MSKGSRPWSLLDTQLIMNLPQEAWYGADHTPSLPSDPLERQRLYEAATAAVVEKFAECDGLIILVALAAMRFCAIRAEQTETGVLEAELELAQAIYLKFPRGSRVPTSEDILYVAKQLKLHMLLFLDATSKPATGDEALLYARRRSDTLHVRHTFYPNQAFRFYTGIAKEFGSARCAEFNFTFHDVSRLAFAVATFITIQAESAVLECGRWLSGEARPDFSSWLTAFALPIDLFASKMETSLGLFSNLVGQWSCGSASLAQDKLEHLHLDNPVWARPLVSEADLTFCFNPNTFVAFHFDLCGKILNGRMPNFFEKLGQARGRILEREMDDLLRRLIPSGEILRNAKWVDPRDNKEYETDAIVLIDELMIIFEAKGGSLSAQGRRGSTRLMQDLDGLLIAAAVQSWRLREVFHPQSSVFEFRVDGAVKTVDRAAIKRVVRFGVSLERLTTTSAGLSQTIYKRITAAGAQPMPAVTIGDLDQLCNLLNMESARIHYLLRREELEDEVEFIADELDLIAMYLKNGFVGLKGREREKRVCAIYGLSDLLRFYQKGEFCYDPTVALPKRTSAFWDRLIEHVEKRRPQGWTAIVYDLLNVPLDGQLRFEKDILSGCRTIRGHGRARSGFMFATMEVPHQRYPSVLVCAVTGKGSPNVKNEALKNFFSELRENHPEKRTLFFVRDGLDFRSETELWDYATSGWASEPRL